jgi:hypothetical protein
MLWLVSRRPEGRPRLLHTGLAVCGGLLLGAGALAATDPLEAPNVPHGLDVSFGEATRGTCFGCHVQGQEGATIIPHESDRLCGDEDQCWAGRSDCLGCHRYDPALGGPTILAQPPPGLPLVAVPRSGTALTTAQLLALNESGEAPDG